jgi:malate synthase
VDGRSFSAELYRAIRNEELSRLPQPAGNRLADAAHLLDELVLDETLEDFLTLRAYELLA